MVFRSIMFDCTMQHFDASWNRPDEYHLLSTVLVYRLVILPDQTFAVAWQVFGDGG